MISMPSSLKYIVRRRSSKVSVGHVSLGNGDVAPGRTALTIERVAVNVLDFEDQVPASVRAACGSGDRTTKCQTAWIAYGGPNFVERQGRPSARTTSACVRHSNRRSSATSGVRTIRTQPRPSHSTVREGNA